MRFRITRTLTLGTALLALAIPATATPRAPAGDIIATLKVAGKFNTLLAMIQTAGMTATLQGKGPFTLFAPTDSAFAALPPAKLGVLKEKGSVEAVVKFYIVPGIVGASEFKTRADAQSYASFTTLKGDTIKVHMGRHVGKEFASLQGDLTASNGVVHIVDKVMVP